MPMYKKSLLILLILALAAAGGTIYGIYSQNQSETLDSAEQDTEAVSRTITVYVTGAVNKPGVVTVPEGARAADAINVCGGVLPNVDKDSINMAQVLKDGQQLRVPERKAGSSGSSSAGSISSKDGQININTAGQDELDGLEVEPHELAKDLAMHIAASKPKSLDASGVSAELLDTERRVAIEKAREAGKPEAMLEKIAEGTVQKYLKDVTLLGQVFVKAEDGKQTIEQLLKAKGASVAGFTLFMVGEGIEKKVDDFAAEVAAQAAAAAAKK